MMMAPTSDALPECGRAWGHADALLGWRYQPPTSQDIKDASKEEHPEALRGRFVVRGFDGHDVRCEWPVEVEGDDSKGESWYKSLYRRLKELFLGAAPPRAPPSMANPSFVLGVKIDNEDDVLHVKELPDFGGRLTARQCELLMQYVRYPGHRRCLYDRLHF